MSRNSKKKRDVRKKDRLKAARRHESRGHDPSTCPDCIARRAAFEDRIADVAPEINRESDAEFANTRFRSYSYRTLGDSPPTSSRAAIDTLMANVLDAALQQVAFEDDMDVEESSQVLEYLAPESDLDTLDGTVVSLQGGFLQVQVAKSNVVDNDESALTAVVHASLSVATPAGSFGVRLAILQEIDNEVMQLWTRNRGMFAQLVLVADSVITEAWLETNPAAMAVLNAMAEAFQIRVPGDGIQPMVDQSQLALSGMVFLAEQVRDTEQAANEARTLRRDLALVSASRDSAQRRADALDVELTQARAKLLARSGQTASQPTQAGLAVTDSGPAQEHIERLQAQLARQTSIAEDRQSENAALRRELYELQRSVLTQINSRAQEHSPVVDYPADFAHLEEWALANLQSRVVLHPKAIAAATDSNYQNPAKAYACLQALAELYWPMLYDTENRDPKVWDARCAELGVECSKVGTAATDARTSDYYTVIHQGRRLVADMHLRGNSSFDPRFSLRVYFTRDDDSRSLVVTSLPSHLPNRAS